MRVLAAILLLTLPACAATAEQRQGASDSPRDWRFVATGHDRERLRDWRDAFKTALERARAAGHSADIDREGVLLRPDAAIGEVPIPNGNYRCRVIKVGAKTAGMLEFVSYPDFACRVRSERGIQGFAKLTGSQRPVGLIFPNDALRQVFLGTLVLGDETRAMQYGRDEERDIAAFVEKIGPNRWRMVMPYPAFESLTDVMELIPAS